MNVFKNKKDLINLLIIFLVIIFLLYNVFTAKFIGGTNDMEHHAYHMWILKDSVVNYHKIPSWNSDCYGGKPYLGLYQPLTYFLALPISLIFGGLLTPKIFILVISLLSAFFFYLLAKKIFKNRWMILVSTLIFITFPNRLMSISGGGLAQLTGVMFVPLIFYLYESYKETLKLLYLSLIGLFMGLCLLTTHAVGGPLIFAFILMIGYDYLIEKDKRVLKVIPFLILGVIIALVFILPSYQMHDTLNFAVASKSGEGFRPFSYFRFFSRTGSRGEFLGILGAVAFLFSILSLRKNKRFSKYIIVSLGLLVLGLHFCFLIPNLVKGTLQGAYRFLSVLSVSWAISITVGFWKLGNLIFRGIKKYKILNIKNKSLKYKKYVKMIIIFLLVISILISYSWFKPAKGNELQIPNEVVEFYKELAKDKEYYRIEDQAFAPFGTSPIMHKHGVLNGAPSHEAPKYHFYFWSSAWKILSSPAGAQNFAGLYGTLSIKYFLFKNKVEIPYLKEIKKGQNYYIYENEKFLDHVRLVPNIVVINIKEPDYIPAFLNFIANNVVPFDKIGFVHSTILKEDVNLNRTTKGKVEILNREPDHLKLKLSNIKEKTYLVVAESYHPYWRASLNGKELNIYKGIPPTLIIPIEENGVVEIKFEYTKLKIILFYLTLITIMFLIGLCIYDIKKKK